MSQEIIGRLVNLGVAVEATPGVGVAPDHWTPNTEFTVEAKTVKVDSGERHGNIDDSTDSFVTEKYAEGSIAGEVRDIAIGYWFNSLLGTLNTTSLGGGVYQHDFTQLNTNQHPPLTLVASDPIGDDRMFKYAMIDNFELTMKVGELSTYTSDFQSKYPVATTQTPSYAGDEHKFVSHHVSVYLADTLAGLDVATELPLMEATLTTAKNLKRENTFQSVEPVEFHNQQFAVEGSFMLNLEDFTYRDLDESNAYKAMRIELKNTDVDLGGGNNPTIQIDMPRVSLRNWERSDDLDEILTQTVEFKAHQDVENGYNVINRIRVVNTKATY